MSRQRAVITITETDDGKFKGTLFFEPSIREGKQLKPGIEDNPAVQAAWFVWQKLKDQQKCQIILTDG